MDFYIGSYTKMGGPGVGRCRLTEAGLTLEAAFPLPNSTYLIFNRAGNRLFAISSDPVSAAEGGSVASFDLTDGCLRLISRQDTLGAGPCHLCLDAEERFLYTANYFTGSVSVFPVSPEGVIGPCLQHSRHAGHSVHPVRQTGPHAHQVTFVPGEDVLCAVDLGLDQLVLYRRQPDGTLLPLPPAAVPPGLGPRHLVYGKGGLAYLACEVGNQVLTLRWTGQTFAVLQQLPTLPPDFAGVNTAAAIRLTSDGRQVLISNRGHNSIACYDVGADGLLAPAGIFPTGDDFPRDFALTDDRTLLIGHQKGALRLARRTETGLRPLAALDVKGCVCIALLPERGEKAP